jgi:hypothetical protein
MATHQLAKGLASLGRHGDSMLVHMTPSEVAGLKAIGAMTGRKLTTNPYTGMPEAFSLGDFFTSLIPTGIGFLLGGPAGAAIGESLGPTAAAAAPVVGGMAAGAAIAGAKGDDPLLGGVMGGLGGFGGGNLASTFGKMGANAATAANAANAVPVAGGYTTPALEETLKKGIAGPMLPNAGTTNTALLQAGTFNPALSQSIPSAAVSTMPSASENIMTGLKQFASDPFGKGYKAFTDAGGSGMQLAAPLGMAALSGAQEDLYPEPDMSMEEKRKAEENKYKDPRTGLLNLAQASPGLKLMATGGTVGSNQSTINGGGIQDLYGTNDQTTGNQQLSKDGYGIGRLEKLASAGSNAKAADTFYAMGGPIAFAQGGHQGYLDGEGDGMSDSIPATIEGKQPARLADGEFVIPADVVSHIGNGSSKAGSKKLYAMLDRVRKARTGHTKQGKEINPNKYMPA